MGENEEPLNITDAARMFGVHRDTMAKWLDDPARGFVTVTDKHGVRKVTAASVGKVLTHYKARRVVG